MAGQSRPAAQSCTNGSGCPLSVVKTENSRRGTRVGSSVNAQRNFDTQLIGPLFKRLRYLVRRHAVEVSGFVLNDLGLFPAHARFCPPNLRSYISTNRLLV